MDHRTKLLKAFQTYCERTSHTFSTASRYASGSGVFYSRLLEGANFTNQRYETAMAWLRKNTPKVTIVNKEK